MSFMHYSSVCVCVCMYVSPLKHKHGFCSNLALDERI